MPENGQQLDLSAGGTPRRAGQNTREKRFVGVHFSCCDVYTRIYKNRAKTAYVGYCPRCAKRIELGIGSGGTDARFFTAQ